MTEALCVCGATLKLKTGEYQPQRLGNYLLVKRLGIGGMGEVFLAKQAGVEGFERQVAIKKMLPHLSRDRNFIDMMVREAKLTVTLNHPNIVQVFDLSKEGDEYYIAMEFVPAVDLGAILESAGKAGIFLPVNVVLCVVAQIIKGLQYAHEHVGPDGTPQAILHRDITPHNVLVTRDARVKITDFGIAKALNEVSTTNPGTIKGKLGYFAPEQLRTGQVDLRLDIFCVGIVLWESLAGRRLFKGEDEIGSYREVLEKTPDLLSTMRDDVTTELDQVIQKALAKDPTLRYQTMGELYTDMLRANFDQSFDDLQKDAVDFFSEHPELFEKNVDESPTDTSNAATIASGLRTRTGLPPITDLTLNPVAKKKRSLRPLITGITVLAFAVLAVAGWQLGLVNRLAPEPVTPAVTKPAQSTSATKPAGEPDKVDKSEAKPEPKPRDGGKKGGRTQQALRPIEQSDIQATVRGLQGPVSKCLSRLDESRAPDKLMARVEVNANGKVDSVTVTPTLPDPGVDRCLTLAIRSARFRPSTDSFLFNMPLVVQRVP